MKTDDSIHKQKDFLTTAEKDTPLVPAETFAKLYQKNYLSVYRYIYAFTGGFVEQAEDLTAETFMRAWKNRTAFHGKTSSAVGWIIRIAHNLVVDSYRHEKTGPDIRPDPLDEELDLPTAASLSPEGQVMAAEQQQIILSLLGELPPDQREILVLRYLLNWKIRQIAQYLDFPENTVSVYIRRALEKMKLLWPTEKESIE